MLDAQEDQASMYELIEAKKKQQEYKVKLYSYYMKYGKNMSEKVSIVLRMVIMITIRNISF